MDKMLKQKRASYIQASDIGRLNHVADVLFHHGMMTQEQVDSVHSIRSPQDRARTMIDVARKNGSVVCETFMDAWENYHGGTAAAAPEVAHDVLAMLDELTLKDISRLKFVMLDIHVYDQPPVSRATLDPLTHRTQIADAIVQRYKDKARAVLLILLERISRNDLVERLRSGAHGQMTRPRGDVTLAGYGSAIRGNAAQVRMKVFETLEDLSEDSFIRFVWMLRLPPYKSERITSVSDLVDVLTDHVTRDTFVYVETVYATLRLIRSVNLAERLATYIRSLSV